jgi:twitching motility protein PilT
MSDQFSWEKHLSPDQAGSVPPAPQAQPGGLPPVAPPAAAPGGGLPEFPSAPPASAAAPASAPPAAMESVAPITFTQSPIEADHNVPAHVPLELRTPEKFRGKFFVGDDIQTPTYDGEEQVASTTGIHLDEILRMAYERKASDIHMTAGLPPMMRLDGEIVSLPFTTLKPEETQRLLYEILTDDQITKFESTHELDCGYTVKGLSRFRVNVYQQRQSVSAALRIIPNRIPTFEELRLPNVIREVAKRHSGLVLVTGPTGSGKSTSIASMIDDINETRKGHILTIEDPIEYLHKHKKCMVNQRELHDDTYSFHNALRAVLREDPDIILVGELRDLETIEAALTLAETGHLVFGTLHTRNAPSTIDRIIDVFPADQQEQIRVLLGNTLEAVISQQLLPKLGGGRVAALEIMLGIPAIKNLIREGKTHQMYSVIETNSNVGMVTMDRSLADHFKSGQVAYDECLMRSVDKDSFSRLAKGIA